MKTVVGFLSRPHGFNALKGLIESPNYEIKQIYTHSLKPASEDPNRVKRDDFDLFSNICHENNIPLTIIDRKNDQLTSCPNCDFIVEVSWRYLIPDKIVQKARIAAFGIHRGKLPEYAGAEPIKQALMKNEKEIYLTSHYLDNKIDQGSTISFQKYPVHYNENESFEQNIQRLRNEITPLFSKLMLETLEKLTTN